MSLASGGGQSVVVGVDGSEESVAALRWGARYAAATGGRVLAVTAWRYPIDLGFTPMVADFDVAKKAAQVLGEAVSKVVADGTGVRIEQRVREGHPSWVLEEESRDADLLVVASRGRGAFAGMLLGSVSAHCARHAACPVVIVRGPVE